MLCELCGKEAPRTKQVAIEGTLLSVCKDCSRFGTEPGVTVKKGVPIPTSVRERLEARRRRMKQRDIYAEEVLDLATDYAERIKGARKRKGWSQEQLAAKVMEKVSVIKKVENGQMRPTEGLRKKLEKSLGIGLLEKSDDGPVEYRTGGKSRALTLGDLIKRG